MRFTGLHGNKYQVFGLNNVGNGGVQIIILTSSLRIDLATRAAVLDCAVVALHSRITPSLMEYLGDLGANDKICPVDINDAELELWRRVFPAWVERCRTWSHRADCEYAQEGMVPLSGEQLLCTCGTGVFRAGFIKGVAHWDVLSRYAVRVAISPAFWAPFVDEMYRPSSSERVATSIASQPSVTSQASVMSQPQPSGDRCATCGKDKGKKGAALLKCAGCKKAGVKGRLMR